MPKNKRIEEEEEQDTGLSDLDQIEDGGSDAENEEIIYAEGEDEDGPDDIEEIPYGPTGATETEHSDDEQVWDDPSRNTVGNIPMHYYDDEDHIGYNIRGEKLTKTSVNKDKLDEFLAREDDPNFLRTVRDVLNQRDVVLSDEEFNIIRSLLKRSLPTASDPYLPFIDLPNPESHLPLTAKPPRKAEFIPSKWEAAQVRKLLYSMRQGWLKLPSERAEEEKKKKQFETSFYNLWENDNEDDLDPKKRRGKTHMAPKQPLPTHHESYNPSGEYLFTQEERDAWHALDPEDRKPNFIPQHYRSLREVPAYAGVQRERFERCMDLFMAARVTKAKAHLTPEMLLPELPHPSTLRPFPSVQTMEFLGHTGYVRSLDIHSDGQWLLSGSEDKTVRLWEVETGRCFQQWSFDHVVYSVQFNPSKTYPSIIAVAAGNTVYLLNSGVGTEEQVAAAEEVLLRKRVVAETDKQVVAAVQWEFGTREEKSRGILVKITHERAVKTVNWHHKGDYLLSVVPDASSIKNSLTISQISAKRSQNPFKLQKGIIQYARFHPSKPLLFVANQHLVKVYNLAQLKLEKKLEPGVRHIANFDIHPKGDNIILGSYDRRVAWFDMDLSVRPYKLFRHHTMAVRRVCYHKRLPLFASCSDDLQVSVFHGMVYDDLLKNPFLVPLSILRGHKTHQHLGILDIIFHPVQPWLFSAGADHTIRLFT